MTTYEHGRAPADAPVTWDKSCDKRGEYQWNLSDGSAFVCVAYSAEAAERACQWAHLAALADEVAGMLGGAPLTPPGTTDWLRRYRAAKGER